MANKYLKSLSRTLWDSDLIATRISLFFAELLWAIMLVWPGETFHRPIYIGMSTLAEEETWALIFLVTAILQLGIVVVDTLHSKFARYFAAWNAVLWLYITLSMLVSMYPPPAAIGGDIALAFASGWVFIRPYILSEGYKRAGY
jgi:hypothetical protein